MNIGFLLQRNTYLKTLGCLIRASYQKDHQVFIFFSAKPEAKAKAYQQITAEELQIFANSRVEMIQIKLEDIAHLKTDYTLDVLVTEEGYHTLNAYLDHVERLRKSGTKLVSLSHFFEIAKRPMEALEHFDKTFYLSEYARDLHFELQVPAEQIEEKKNRLSSRIAITGSPMFDQFENIEKKQLRAELGISPRQKIVLLMAPVIAPITPWRFHVWRDDSKWSRTRSALKARKAAYIQEIWTGNTFRELLTDIRAFCDQNKARLIIKSRGKQFDPPYMTQNADEYYDGFDDKYFPLFTTYKLMAVANLCITINSMSAVEAVVAGVPCINIYVPHNDDAVPIMQIKAKYNQALLGGKKDSLMNYQGCILKIDRRKVSKWMRSQSLNDVKIEQGRRKEFLRKYLGIEGQSASQRILQELER